MSNEFLSVLIIAAALAIFVFVLIGVALKRKDYCGEDFKSCFWCDRDCTFHALDKVSVQDSQ